MFAGVANVVVAVSPQLLKLKRLRNASKTTDFFSSRHDSNNRNVGKDKVYTPGYLLTARWAFEPWDEGCNRVAVKIFPRRCRFFAALRMTEWYYPAFGHSTYNRT